MFVLLIQDFTDGHEFDNELGDCWHVALVNRGQLVQLLDLVLHR